MNKYRLLKIFVLTVSVVPFIFAQRSGSSIITGFITDTLCGAKGENEFHTDCAKRSVASGKVKYALYDDRARRLYVIEPQTTAEQYLGQRVRITGTLSASPLRNAGEMLAPDATAGQIDRSTGSLPPPTGSPRVQRHARPD